MTMRDAPSAQAAGIMPAGEIAGADCFGGGQLAL